MSHDFFFNHLKLQLAFKKILFLYYFQVSLFLLAALVKWIIEISSFTEMLITQIFILIFSRLAYRSLIKLYYSYWTFTAFFFLYAIGSLVRGLSVSGLSTSGNWQLIQINFILLIVMSVQAYLLSSPIYFPRVRWWVYDFRYRGDLVIKLKGRDEGEVVGEVEKILIGRLTDLRRNAGCILLLKPLNIGECFYVYVDSRYSEVRLLAEIVSVREYSFGRGFIHGVKFIFDDPEDLKIYREFVSYWREDIHAKAQMEFEEKQEQGEYLKFYEE